MACDKNNNIAAIGFYQRVGMGPAGASLAGVRASRESSRRSRKRDALASRSTMRSSSNCSSKPDLAGSSAPAAVLTDHGAAHCADERSDADRLGPAGTLDSFRGRSRVAAVCRGRGLVRRGQLTVDPNELPSRGRDPGRRRKHSGRRDRTHSRLIESFDYQPHGQDHLLETDRGAENIVHGREAEVPGEADVDVGDQAKTPQQDPQPDSHRGTSLDLYHHEVVQERPDDKRQPRDNPGAIPAPRPESQ